MTDTDEVPAKKPKLEIEKVASIPTEFEKWNFLPPEIKAECIKKMTIRMRYNLRATSFQHYHLVNAVKLTTYRVAFHSNKLEVSEKTLRGNFANFKEYYEAGNGLHTVSLLCYALKASLIQTFSIRTGFENREILDFIARSIENHSIRINDFEGCEYDATIVFLRSCWHHIQRISVLSFNNEQIEEFFSIPAVLNTRKIILLMIENPDSIVIFVQKWIENDVKFGTRVEITDNYRFGDNEAQTFVKFEDRKVMYFNNKLRIRTDNPAKHILMFFRANRFCCVVIRASYNIPQCEEYVFGF